MVSMSIWTAAARSCSTKADGDPREKSTFEEAVTYQECAEAHAGRTLEGSQSPPIGTEV